MADMFDYGPKVSEFKLLSYCYVQLKTNTLWKGMHPLILPALLLITHESGYAIKQRNQTLYWTNYTLHTIPKGI